MASASGTSVAGIQTILTGSTSPGRTYSIAITTDKVLPVRSVGYYWIIAVAPGAAPNRYVVDRGIMSKPGVWKTFTADVNTFSYLITVQVDWDSPGLGWSVNVA